MGWRREKALTDLPSLTSVLWNDHDSPSEEVQDLPSNDTLESLRSSIYLVSESKILIRPQAKRFLIEPVQPCVRTPAFRGLLGGKESHRLGEGSQAVTRSMLREGLFCFDGLTFCRWGSSELISATRDYVSAPAL